MGIGASCVVGTMGAANARHVHATATTRTIALIACFMAFSLHAGPLGAET